MFDNEADDFRGMLKELMDSVVEDIGSGHDSMAEFAEAVREEEVLYVWFGADKRGRDEMRYTVQARSAGGGEALEFAVCIQGGPETVLYTLPQAGAAQDRSLQSEDLGTIDREASARLLAALQESAELEEFTYRIRTYFMNRSVAP